MDIADTVGAGVGILSPRFYKLLLAASLAGLLIAAGIAVLLVIQQDADTETPSRSRSTVKEFAPDFTLTSIDGGSLRYGEIKGKPILVNFFASWCLPCREEMPAIERIAREYKAKGVVFLGVAVDDTEAKMREFLTRFDVSFPVGLDSGATIQKSFGVYGIPTTYFIDRQGVINYFHAGAVTEELLRHELDKLL